MSERVVILGGGESGTGAAILAKVKGFDVFLSDNGSLKDKYKTELSQEGIAFEEGSHTEEKILGANLLRVLVLILLVLWYGWGVLDSFIHPLSGMVTCALALPCWHFRP